MNKETYEALKRIMNGVDKNENIPMEDFKKVEDWIDEVSKDYEEDKKDEIFTPIFKGKRLTFKMKDVSILEGEIGRGNEEGTIMGKVEIKGKKYNVYQRSCNLPNCNCDAEIKEI